MALYARIDTNWLWNRHMVKVGPAARLLYIGGLSYCVENLTDGRIPKEVLNRIADVDDRSPAKSAKALVDAGRWSDEGECWLVHDYDAHQETKAKVEAKREKWRNKKSGDKGESTTGSPGASTGDSPGDSLAVSPGESKGESTGEPPSLDHRSQITDLEKNSSSPLASKRQPKAKTATKTDNVSFEAALEVLKAKFPDDRKLAPLATEIAKVAKREGLDATPLARRAAAVLDAANLRPATLPDPDRSALMARLSPLHDLAKGADDIGSRWRALMADRPPNGFASRVAKLVNDWDQLTGGGAKAGTAHPFTGRVGNGATELDPVTQRYVTPAELARLQAERAGQQVPA